MSAFKADARCSVDNAGSRQLINRDFPLKKDAAVANDGYSDVSSGALCGSSFAFRRMSEC